MAFEGEGEREREGVFLTGLCYLGNEFGWRLYANPPSLCTLVQEGMACSSVLIGRHSNVEPANSELLNKNRLDFYAHIYYTLYQPMTLFMLIVFLLTS